MSSGGFRSPVIKKSVNKRRIQYTLASFFGSSDTKRKRVVSRDIFGGGVKYQCPYCFKWFTTQGFPNHKRFHERNGDKVTGKKPNGQVKLHGAKYDKPFVGGTSKETTSTSMVHPTKDTDSTVHPTKDTTSPVDLTHDTTSTSPVDLTNDSTSTPPDHQVEPRRNSTGGQRNLMNKVSLPM